MALDIAAIAAKLNELAPSHPIGKLQELRMQLKKPIYRRLFGGKCLFALGVTSALLAADIRVRGAKLSATCRCDTSSRPSNSAPRPTPQRMIPLRFRRRSMRSLNGVEGSSSSRGEFMP